MYFLHFCTFQEDKNQGERWLTTKGVSRIILIMDSVSGWILCSSLASWVLFFSVSENIFRKIPSSDGCCRWRLHKQSCPSLGSPCNSLVTNWSKTFDKKRYFCQVTCSSQCCWHCSVPQDSPLPPERLRNNFSKFHFRLAFITHSNQFDLYNQPPLRYFRKTLKNCCYGEACHTRGC